jgi:membrane-bound inhibitor of C-type lysozyme
MDGGAMHNSGTLSVTDSVIRASSARYGGGIYNEAGATATLNNTTLMMNQRASL